MIDAAVVNPARKYCEKKIRIGGGEGGGETRGGGGGGEDKTELK